MQNLISQDYLMHHGVKGMKWGVRKRMEAYGYGEASRYTQKRDIRNLKQKKRQGQISSSSYKSQKAAIRHKAAAERGRKLVEANETHAKVTARAAAKTAAFGVGLTAAGFMLGGPTGAIGGAAVGGMHGIYQTRNAIRRNRDISAYRR